MAVHQSPHSARRKKAKKGNQVSSSWLVDTSIDRWVYRNQGAGWVDLRNKVTVIDGVQEV